CLLERRRGRRSIAANDFVDLVGAELLVDNWHTLIERVTRTRHHRERLIFDLDRIQRIERLIARLSDYRRDYITDVMDFARGKDRPQHLAHWPAIGERHGVHAYELAEPGLRPILRRHNPQNAGTCSGVTSLNSHDPRVRIRAAQERSID